MIYKDQGGENFIFKDKEGVYELLLTKSRNSLKMLANKKQ